MKEIIEYRIQTVLLFMESCTHRMKRYEKEDDLKNHSFYSGELSASEKELAFLKSLLSKIK
jgi:hypothetical protein